MSFLRLTSFILILLQASNCYSQKNCLQKMHMFDIGSGGVKSSSYLVNKCTETLLKNLNKDYDSTLSLQQCISNSPTSNIIPQECIVKASSLFDKILKKLNINCFNTNEKCIAIATAWARNATNSSAVLKKLKSFNIESHILSQHEEGELAFLSLVHNIKIPKQDLMLFDLGGGSFQLSSYNHNKVHVYNGKYGLFNFKKLLLGKLGLNSEKQLNPTLLPKAQLITLKTIGLPLKLDSKLTKKLKNPALKVFASGAFMNRGVKEQLNLGNNPTISEIEKALRNIFGKNAMSIQRIYPKLPTIHAENTQFSLLIIYSIMSELNIRELNIIEGDKLLEYLAIHERKHLLTPQ